MTALPNKAARAGTCSVLFHRNLASHTRMSANVIINTAPGRGGRGEPRAPLIRDQDKVKGPHSMYRQHTRTRGMLKSGN